MGIQITLEEYMQILAAEKKENISLELLLARLGITANYKGFYYTIDAVEYAINDPESLTLVTKILYPKVAKKYKKGWTSTERNIRTAVDLAWNNNSVLLEEIAQHSLYQKPTVSEFLSIITQYITTHKSN